MELQIEVVVPVEDMGQLGTVIEDATSGPAAAGPVRRSIWPAMHPRLLELVQQHNSTLIFVNARRLAERLATRLNELAEEQATIQSLKACRTSALDLRFARRLGLGVTESLDRPERLDAILRAEPALEGGVSHAGWERVSSGPRRSGRLLSVSSW